MFSRRNTVLTSVLRARMQLNLPAVTRVFRTSLAASALLGLTSISYRSYQNRCRFADVERVIELKGIEQWNSIIEDDSDTVYIVDFYADWCGPCNQLYPMLLRTLEQRGKNEILVKINVDVHRDIANSLAVRGIPIVFKIERGAITAVIQGLPQQKELDDFLNHGNSDKKKE